MADPERRRSPRTLLRVLGALEISGANGAELRALVVQPKRVALLTYLAVVHPGQFHRRDTLLALFWPELEESRARGALSQALSHLRHWLGPDALCSRGAEEIALDGNQVWCDAAAFHEYVRAGQDKNALSLHRGDLLEGFFLSGASAFEQWLEGARHCHRELARGAANRLAAEAASRGDRSAALLWSRRALDLAPYDEPAFRHIVELLDGMGDRAGAIREYDAFAERLRRDLDVDPSPETRALLGAVRTRSSERTPLSPMLADAARNSQETAHSAAGRPAEPPNSRRAASVTEVGARRPGIGRVRVGRAGTLVLLVVIAVTLSVRRDAVDLEPRRVVVIPFENQTGDSTLNEVGTIAADWIVQGLAQVNAVHVIPSTETLARLDQFSEEERAGRLPTRARAVARALGAGTAVTGTFYSRDLDLQFQAQAVDARDGRLLRAVDEARGPRANPMVAIDRLRRRIAEALVFHFDPRTQVVAQEASRPPTFEAYQAFVVGMDLRSTPNWRESVRFFRRAYALDTTFSSALLLALIQYANMNDFARADSLTRLLAGSRERLAPFDRRSLAWAESYVRGDLERSWMESRSLLRFGDAFRMHAAYSAIVANQPREAIELLSVPSMSRHVLSLPTSGRIAFGRRLADAYHRLADYRAELKGVDRTHQRDAVVVESLLWELRALAGLRQVHGVGEKLEEILALPPTPSWPAGEIMLRASDELRVHGDAAESRGVLARALEWYRALPDSQAKSPRHRRHRAAALLRANAFAEAEAEFVALAAEFPDDPYHMASLAVSLARRGQSDSAMNLMNTALEKVQPYDYGHHAYERARVAAELGHADLALGLLRQAFAQGFRFGFVGGTIGTAAPPDGAPHLDSSFDSLRNHPGFLDLERGRERQ